MDLDKTASSQEFAPSENIRYDISPYLRSKIEKYFTAIEDMVNELTTGNVAHKKAAIKGFAGRAKEYLIKHT